MVDATTVDHAADHKADDEDEGIRGGDLQADHGGPLLHSGAREMVFYACRGPC